MDRLQIIETAMKVKNWPSCLLDEYRSSARYGWAE